MRKHPLAIPTLELCGCKPPYCSSQPEFATLALGLSLGVGLGVELHPGGPGEGWGGSGLGWGGPGVCRRNGEP